MRRARPKCTLSDSVTTDNSYTLVSLSCIPLTHNTLQQNLFSAVYLSKAAAMKFAGPDLMISKFQTDIIVVFEHIFTEEALHEAATRLLAAWPLLSYRTTLTVSTLWYFL